MRVIRLALLTVAAGLLMAPGLGRVSVGDGSATLPIGDSPIGDRTGGCPAFPATPVHHFAARLESYANNDPVPTATAQGSLALDATQGTGSAQPTFKLPCDSGDIADQGCYDGDGGDHLATGSHTALSGSTTHCMVIRNDVTGANYFYADGLGCANRNRAFVLSGGTFRFVAGSSATTTTALTNGSYYTICGTLDGASSEVFLNGSSEWTGNAGTDKITGLRLFADCTGGSNANGAIAEYAVFEGAVDEDAVHDVFSCHYGSSWPQSLEVEPDTVTVNAAPRWKRYAMALHKRGLRPAQVAARLVAKGLDEDTARQVARRLRGRTGRDPDSLHTVRVGLVARAADDPTESRQVARALCKPLDDEDGDTNPEAVACFQAERTYLAERWCEVGQTTPVLHAARAWMTADEAARVQVRVDNRPTLRGIRNATDTRFNNLLQSAATAAGFGVVERCGSGAPS